MTTKSIVPEGSSFIFPELKKQTTRAVIIILFPFSQCIVLGIATENGQTFCLTKHRSSRMCHSLPKICSCTPYQYQQTGLPVWVGRYVVRDAEKSAKGAYAKGLMRQKADSKDVVGHMAHSLKQGHAEPTSGIYAYTESR